MTRDAFIFDAVRTARGVAKPNGGLASYKPIELLHSLFAALQARNPGLDTAEVSDVVLGCVTQVGEQGANLAKIAALYAGWSERISGVTLNRFCTSGLDAVNYAALKVMSGFEDLVVAGGVESMSRVPMLQDGGSWFSDPEVARRTGFVHMGLSADLIATLRGLERAELDAFAVRSHHRAARAWQEGRFSRSVITVGQCARDEAIRPDTTADKLGKLPVAFATFGAEGGDAILSSRYPQAGPIQHVHHVGTSPALVDGAALVLVGSLEKGRALGLEPRARVVAMANHSVDPVIMLTAPEGALRKAVRHANIGLGDLDRVECNESFAATVLDFIEKCEIDPDKVNVNGGALAMGHPLGATGAMLVGTLIDELERAALRTGAVAMCGGAGVGVATVFARS